MIRTMLIALLGGALAAGCGSPTPPPADPTDQDERDDQVEEVTVTGTLVGVAAIGGESTGYGLQTDDGGQVELDLTTHGLAEEFEEGKRVTVTGEYVTVTGVEIPERQVLQVSRIEPASGR